VELHLTITPSKMIWLFQFPDAHSPQQQQVCGYLCTMIGNLGTDQLHLLMRFISGSCVCTTDKIIVEFNGLSGLARCPIAHTCDYVIELPTSYINYDDFYTEFSCILKQTHDDFSWQMDAL